MKQHRIEISPLPNWREARGEGTKAQILNFLNINIDKVLTRDVYTISANISDEETIKIASLLVNPVLQGYKSNSTKSDNFVELEKPNFLVIIGFKPGVTDNVGRSAKAAIGDILGRKLAEDEYVFSSVEYLLYGDNLDINNVTKIANGLLGNELIQSITVLTGDEASKNIPMNLPIIEGCTTGDVNEYDLEVSDDELVEISRKGTLALTLEEMKVIQN